MAGPVQGNTRTRIFGIGYKPPHGKVDLKWGILKTDNVEKDQVSDYVYN